jgi:hypothetical protein
LDNFAEVIKLGDVGLISGLFSAFLAVWQYRDNKWWELRVASYQALIEALSDLTHYLDRKYNAEIESRELSQAYEDELKQLWTGSYHEVRKAADSGVFLFSKEVNEKLKEFINLKDTEYNSYFEQLDEQLFEAEKCLKVVVYSAQRELRRNDHWLSKLAITFKPLPK